MMKRLKCGVFGLVALFLSVSFGFCADIVHLSRQSVTLNIGATMNFGPGFCLNGTNTNNGITAYYSDGTQATSSFSSTDNYCFNVSGYIKNNGSQQRLSYYFTGISVGSCSCPSCPSCPDCPVCEENVCDLYVSQDGLNSHFQYSGNIDRFTLNLDENITWFNSVNGNSSNFNFQSSCLTGNFCTGSIESGNRSALFINDIQHVSAPLINITIPEEFDWDYTGTDEEFDLDVKGFNVDTEYIDGLIRTQTTLPNSTDFNNTVSGLIPLFVPGLVIILLIYFIFRFIKKIF